MREMDIGMIERLLPHRYPMLLVDRVLDWEAGKFLRGLKNVTANEPFFAGHFPAYPVMPGVLVIEAMAQVAGLLTMLSDVARRDGSQLVLFAGIDEARFKRQVFPGDTLMLEAQLERHQGTIWCESAPDEGTTMLFTLPTVDRLQAPAGHAPAVAA